MIFALGWLDTCLAYCLNLHRFWNVNALVGSSRGHKFLEGLFPGLVEISDAAAVEAVEDKSDITEEAVDPVTVTIQEDVEAEGEAVEE